MAGTQTLTTRATIEAVDKLTGPLNTMGAKVNSFALGTQKRLDTLSASYAKIGTAFSKLPLAGGMLGAGFALHGVMDHMMEFDKKLRQVAAVNLMTKGQMVGLQGTISDITDKTGVLPEKVLEAAEAYQQLNGDLKNFNEVAQIAARTSVITGSDMAHQITAISAAGKAFGLDMKKAENARDIENTFLVAAKGMRGGMPAFEQAIKTAGPVAKQLYGWDLKETAALIQTLGGQFEAGEIGTAIKSVGARLQALPKKALMQLGVAGGDVLSLMGADPEKAKGLGAGLTRALLGNGFNVDAAHQAQLQKLAANADLMTKEGRDKFHKEYMRLAETLPGNSKKGKIDGEDRKTLTEAYNQAMASIQGDHINPAELLKKLDQFRGNKALMAGLFGKEHLPKWLDLLVQQSHVQERINHIREMVDSQKYGVGYKPGTGTFTLDKDDAIAQRWKLFENAPSTQYGRLMGNIQAFWNDVSGRGVGASLAQMFKAGADFARQLQRVDAKTVNALFKGLTAAVAIPAGVMALRAFGGALGAIGGAGVGVVSMFGNLSRAAAVLPWAFEAAGVAVASRFSPAIGGALGMVGRFAGRLAWLSGAGLAVGTAFYAFEHWDEIQESLAKFGKTDTGKGLFSSLDKLQGSAAALGADLLSAVNSATKLLGWQPEGGAFKDWLDLLGRSAKFLVDQLTEVTNFGRALLGEKGVQSPAFNKLQTEFFPSAEDTAHIAELQRWSDSLRASTAAPGPSLAATTPYGASATAPAVVGWGDNPFSRAPSFERSTPLGMGVDLASFADPVVTAQGEAADAISGRVDASADKITSAVQALGPIFQNAAASLRASAASFNNVSRAPAPVAGNSTGGKR